MAAMSDDDHVSDSPAPVRKRIVRKRPAASVCSNRVSDSSDEDVSANDDASVYESCDDSTTEMGLDTVSADPAEAVQWALRKLPHTSCANILKVFNGSINLGTLCSGLDVGVIGAELIQKEWQSATGLSPLKFKHVFACEINEQKRVLSKAEVVWTDVVDVGRGKATDSRTGQITATIGCDVLLAGFVCKDFSMLKSNPIHFRNLDGKSGPTYFGVKNYVNRHLPRIVILENVRAIMNKRSCHADGDVSPAQHVMHEFRAMGYDGGCKIMNSRDYGLPQRRSRCYFVFVYIGEDTKSGYSLQPDKLAADAFQVAKTLKCNSKPLHEFVGGGEQRTTPPRKKKPTWKTKHAAFMTAHGITSEEVTNMMESENFKLQLVIRPARVMHMTAVHYIRMQKMGVDPFNTTMVMQVDQSCDRMPCCDAVCPCVTPRGEYWVTNAGYLLTGYDKLALQGVTHDIQKAKGLYMLKPKLVGDMAGNAFSLPVCNAVLSGALASYANRHG